MTKSNAQKKQHKKKARQKQRQRTEGDLIRKEKAEFYYHEALWYIDKSKFAKAEILLKKSIKGDPGNREKLMALARLGYATKRDDLIIDGLMELYKRQLLDNHPQDNDVLLTLCSCLAHADRHQQAKTIAEEIDVLLKNNELNVKARKKYHKGTRSGGVDYRLPF